MAEAKPESSKQTTSKQVKGAENSGHDSTVGQLGFKYQVKANWGRKGLKEPFGGIMPFAPASQVTRKGRPTLTAHTSYDSPLTIPTTRKAVLLGPPTPLDHTPSINPTAKSHQQSKSRTHKWHFQVALPEGISPIPLPNSLRLSLWLQVVPRRSTPYSTKHITQTESRSPSHIGLRVAMGPKLAQSK